MSASTSPSDDLLLAAETFCLRGGLLSFYSALTFVLVTLILSVLVFTTHLTTILDPLGWGVTLAAILVGLLVNRVFGSYLTDVLVDLIQLGESLAKVPYSETLDTSAHGGTIVAYLTFAFLATGSHVGLYGWAHRIRGLGGYSQRILVAESPTITLVLLLLDFMSALALAGACGFCLAADFRVLRVFLSVDHNLKASVHKRLTPIARLGRLSPSVPSDPDPDNINWRFVTHYCAVLAATALTASVVMFAIGQSLAQLASPTSWVLAVSGTIAGGLLAIRVAAATTAVLTRPLGGSTRLTTITTTLLCGCAILLYVAVVGLLPQPTAQLPIVSTLQAASDTLVVTPSIDVLTAPTFYFEFSRTGSVVGVVATGVALSVYTVRWWRDRSLQAVPTQASRGLVLLTWPIRLFIGKMTAVDSRWSWRVRAGVMIQMLGVVIILQSVSAVHSVWSGVAVTVAGGAVQASFIWLEGTAGTPSSVASHKVWSLLCCLLPPIGGFSFVVGEMQGP